MNNMNSVLIEGKLSSDPFIEPDIKEKTVSFTIVSNRFYKQEDEYKKETTYIKIHTTGRLADICYQYLIEGRCILGIGRLKQIVEQREKEVITQIVVAAKQIEFKSNFKEVK